jgi:DNA-binding response OmpR family regulator
MSGSVLIVDDDRHISALVTNVLRDAGFTVSELADMSPEAIRAEAARIEPDVVLLDGAGKLGYGESWAGAAWLHERARPIAVIMFTSSARDIAEGEQGESVRSRKAAFVGFVSKPFDIDELVEVVTRAVDEPSAVLKLS